MGGSKKQVVGFKYHLGVHMVLCHGPVDALREIRVDDRLAWSATTAGAPGSAGGSVSGGEPFAPRQFATVPDMAASAGATTNDPALVTFTGRLAAVTIGTRLRLVTSGGDAIVTIQSISYDPVEVETTWEVTPSATDFAAQSVTVEEAREGASSAGAAGGDAGSGAAGPGTRRTARTGPAGTAWQLTDTGGVRRRERGGERGNERRCRCIQ